MNVGFMVLACKDGKVVASGCRSLMVGLGIGRFTLQVLLPDL
jgi:hypothetical protein